MSFHSCEISEGIYSWASDGLAAALGYPADGLLGIKEVELLHPEDTALLKSLESCQLDSFEVSYRKRRGADKGYVRLNARRVRLREGERWMALEQVAPILASPHQPGTPGAIARERRSRQYISTLSSSEDAQPDRQAAHLDYSFRTEALHDMTQKLSRLRKFAQLCTDVLLICAPGEPPKLLLSPLCLEILGYGARRDPPPSSAHLRPRRNPATAAPCGDAPHAAHAPARPRPPPCRGRRAVRTAGDVVPRPAARRRAGRPGRVRRGALRRLLAV